MQSRLFPVMLSDRIGREIAQARKLFALIIGKKLFAVLVTETGVGSLERLNLPLRAHSKTTWMSGCGPGQHVLRVFLERGLGAGDLQRCLSNSTSLWFCEQCNLHQACYVLFSPRWQIYMSLALLQRSRQLSLTLIQKLKFVKITLTSDCIFVHLHVSSGEIFIKIIQSKKKKRRNLQNLKYIWHISFALEGVVSETS